MKIISLNNGLGALWYSLIFGLYFCCTPAIANKVLRQNQPLILLTQIKGTITDGNNSLPGVTISVKGKLTTTISDYYGQYTIAASPDDTLVFSFMGFKTVLVQIDGRETINIQLKEDATTLKEVLVNTGYYSVKESERTGSIAKITAAAIEKQPVTNVLAVMQGRMAGVNISQTTGVPGGGFDI